MNNKANPHRIARLSSRMHIELEWILRRDIRNQILRNAVFTRVLLSKDYQYADIGFMHLAESMEKVDIASIQRHLTSLAGMFRFGIAQRMVWRKMPRLRFFHDKDYI